ncbi:MAG TPA: DUF4252 domain-containing protein [Bryobacteraceae bacterium]|nr:DUF4252 domain-containing protein [Bryobacteraceae bacterium]
MRIATFVLAAAALPLWAQEIKLPVNLDALADKAEESVVVTMDKTMLKFAGRFLKDSDDADARKIIAGLDGIYVRSFEFAKEGAYSPADVEAVRRQLQGPAWGRIVGVRSKRSDGDVDVYFKDAGNGQLGGIVVIAAEPRELTIVHIVGTIDPEKIGELGGEFGIPRLNASRIRRISQ